MYSEMPALLKNFGLPLAETWCIEGIIFYLKFRGKGKITRTYLNHKSKGSESLENKMPLAKMIGIFLLVNALTNIPLNLMFLALNSRVSHALLIAFISIMEGAVIPLSEAVFYHKMLGCRSLPDWIVISYEMNMMSYLASILFSWIGGLLQNVL